VGEDHRHRGFGARDRVGDDVDEKSCPVSSQCTVTLPLLEDPAVVEVYESQMRAWATGIARRVCDTV
jgi:hypothetical protein